MKKKYRIYPNTFVVLIIVILCLIYLANIAMGEKGNFPHYFDPRFMLGVLLFSLVISTRIVEFTIDIICIRYAYIIKRSLPVERISSIEFIKRNDIHYIIICLDHHPSFKQANKPFRYFTFSFKVITILMPENKRIECIRQITQLYSNTLIDISLE